MRRRLGARPRGPAFVATLRSRALCPSLALAHTEAARAAGLFAGLHHPVSGLDHVLAMVAVGLWGAQLGAPAVWLLPVTFPMVMAFGGMLGLIGVPLPGVEFGIALSGILLGLAVLAEWRPPLWAAALWSASSPSSTATPMAPSSRRGERSPLQPRLRRRDGMLHAVGIAIGAIHRWTWGRVVLRVAGGPLVARRDVLLW